MALRPTDTRPLYEQNGMTEAEWNALSPEARQWRTDHPRRDGDMPVAASAPRPIDAPMSDEMRHEVAQGAQVVLTGEARDAARGSHSTIEHNIAARDAAIADGHVAPETSRAAITDTLRASIGAPLSADPQAEADRAAAEHDGLRERAKVAGEMVRRPPGVVMSPPRQE